MADRNRHIAAEARQRAQAWAEPGDEVTPVQQRRPFTSDAADRNSNGGAWSTEDGGPIVVGSSAAIVSQRRPGQQQQPPLQQRASETSAAHFKPDLPRGREPLSALHRQQVATPFDCPGCATRYEPPPPSGAGGGNAPRMPVLLVPCGHTLCRACIVAWTRRNPTTDKVAPPTCPLCESAFSGTAVNKAIVSMLPTLLNREEESGESMSNADVLARVSAGGTTELAPLPPALRRTIFAYASEEGHAILAERSARTALAHRRLALLRSDEAKLAEAELHDAAAASTSQAHVERALSGELASIEAELKRLEVERNVVLAQLGGVLQTKSQCAVREHECARRRDTLEAVAAVHHATAERHRSAVLDLTPSESVAQLLDAALVSSRPE